MDSYYEMIIDDDTKEVLKKLDGYSFKLKSGKIMQCKFNNYECCLIRHYINELKEKIDQLETDNFKLKRELEGDNNVK